MIMASAVGAVALLGVACTDDEGAGPAVTATTTTTATATLSPTMTETATGTPAEPAVLIGTIEGLDGNETGGSITLTERDGATEVVVVLTGLEEGAHANHLHAGSCAAVGGVVHPLEELEADAEGNATATSTVEATTEELSTGFYYTVHAGGDDAAGDGIGCADFVAQ